MFTILLCYEKFACLIWIENHIYINLHIFLGNENYEFTAIPPIPIEHYRIFSLSLSFLSRFETSFSHSEKSGFIILKYI